jgi:hypothetical protein
MGLFDSYFDPQQFGEGGGLLSRLIALQRQQGLYQPDADPEPPPAAQTPMPWPKATPAKSLR